MKLFVGLLGLCVDKWCRSADGDPLRVVVGALLSAALLLLIVVRCNNTISTRECLLHKHKHTHTKEQRAMASGDLCVKNIHTLRNIHSTI